MLVLYNFEKAFNKIKGLPIKGNLKEYREFLKSIQPFLGPNRYIDSGKNPVLWEIRDNKTNSCRSKWYYYDEDYHLTHQELQSHKEEYKEEFNFTELFEDFVGAI